MNPEETKAAWDYYKLNSKTPTNMAFLEGIKWARAHPSAEVLALEQTILLLNERIVECDRIPLSIEDLSAQLVGAVEAWRKAKGG